MATPHSQQASLHFFKKITFLSIFVLIKRLESLHMSKLTQIILLFSLRVIQKRQFFNQSIKTNERVEFLFSHVDRSICYILVIQSMEKLLRKKLQATLCYKCFCFIYIVQETSQYFLVSNTQLQLQRPKLSTTQFSTVHNFPLYSFNVL